MRIRKILMIFLALVMAASLGACKPRTAKDAVEKRKGARENIVVPENLPEDERLLLPEDEKDETEDQVSEPVKDTVPEEMAASLFYAATSGDRAKIQQFADYGTLFRLAEGQEPDFMLSQILARLKYEILSSDVGDGKSVVTAKLVNIDMGVVIPRFYEQAMKILSYNTANDTGKTAEELEREYRKVFVDLMTAHDGGRIERLVEVELHKKDGKWEIKSTPELGDAMLGGYLTAQDKVRGDMHMSLEASPENPALDEESSISIDVVDDQVGESSSQASDPKPASSKSASSKSASSKSASSKSASSKSRNAGSQEADSKPTVSDDEYRDID